MKHKSTTNRSGSLVRAISCAAVWMYATTVPSQVVMANRMVPRSGALLIRGGQKFEPDYYGISSPQYEQQQQQYAAATTTNTPPPQYTDDEPQYTDDAPQYTDEHAPQYTDLAVPPPQEGMLGDVNGESFQDRIDTWREYQQQHSEEQQASIRDDQGRLQLLTSVSKGSRVIVFFLLMWRDVYLYEAVDLYYKGTRRLMLVTPLTFMFCANLFGMVASLSSSLSHSGKKRLKAILNLDKLLEMFMVFWSVLRLIVTSASTALIPREIYVGNILHSVFFILQCQAVTRLVWDDNVAVPQHVQHQEAQAYQQAQESQPPPPEYSPNNY